MSGIVIKIKAGATVEESSVTATGKSVGVIADSERASFSIDDSDLKRAVGKYFGQEPVDAFLHSPTPWNDLYTRYKWPQVQRVLKPKSAQILKISTKPTILSNQTFHNSSSTRTTTFSAQMSQEVTNTVSSEWSNSGKVAVEQSIRYELGFLGTSVGGETKLGFERTWGKSETVSKETKVSTTTALTGELKPGESAIVELSASLGTMRVQVIYEAYLIGSTAINYNPAYKGHHFYALDIGAVIGDSNKVEVVEDIELGFYSNATVSAKDGQRNRSIKLYMAAHPDEHPSEMEND